MSQTQQQLPEASQTNTEALSHSTPTNMNFAGDLQQDQRSNHFEDGGTWRQLDHDNDNTQNNGHATEESDGGNRGKWDHNLARRIAPQHNGHKMTNSDGGDGGRWENNFANDDAYQHNGHDLDRSEGGNGCVWTGNHSRGSALQHNGHTFKNGSEGGNNNTLDGRPVAREVHSQRNANVN